MKTDNPRNKSDQKHDDRRSAIIGGAILTCIGVDLRLFWTLWKPSRKALMNYECCYPICASPTGYLHIGGARTACSIGYLPGTMAAATCYALKIPIKPGQQMLRWRQFRGA
ncbi:MAG: hypothetical protein CM15mP46_1380 [Alphaproteobacteria bacterium]|nr:MAG: hypothetical protein CM15mP46_1380 [Alphaproteobacteria bacterium]